LVIKEEIKTPKILVIDIETKPVLAYVWRLFDEVNSLDKIVDAGGMLCFAARWLGSKENIFYSEWEHGRDVMVRAAHALLSEADAVVTYNGDKFDLPKLQAEFATLGMLAPPPLTSIDVYKTARLMGFLSKKLDYVGQALGVGKKVKHDGMSLWTGCMEGKAKDRKKMRKYNIGDVDLLEKVYLRLRPYIKNHPHMGFTPKRQCGACGSSKVQSRGFRRTKAFRIQRIQCIDCGSWTDGSKAKAV
jgi:DNA polymerase elongation subunit (family B)/endogenous inhibitor of DNA gyrase (YacG/DUF329 family)